MGPGKEGPEALGLVEGLLQTLALEGDHECSHFWGWGGSEARMHAHRGIQCSQLGWSCSEVGFRRRQ